MIVTRAQETRNGEHAITARTIFHNHWLSPKSRATILTPLPGPSVTMNRTGRLGHASAAVQGPDKICKNAKMKAANEMAEMALMRSFMVPPQAGRLFIAIAVAASLFYNL